MVQSAKPAAGKAGACRSRLDPVWSLVVALALGVAALALLRGYPYFTEEEPIVLASPAIPEGEVLILWYTALTVAGAPESPDRALLACTNSERAVAWGHILTRLLAGNVTCKDRHLA